MDNSVRNQWNCYYEIAPAQLQKLRQVKRVATAFNANIDAVIKISGEKIGALAKSLDLTENDLKSENTQITNEKDILRGVIKCFTLGIAEEWTSDNARILDWLQSNIGFDRLQMGGQGGIVANAMAALGVKNVYVHTASHSQLQAEQFLDLPALQASDENGNFCQARTVNRPQDKPLIHWIMEFDAGDKLFLQDREFVCPKSNRFIATYDPANSQLKKDDGFIQNLKKTGFDYMILSGFHNLSAADFGIERLKETIPLIKQWKIANPQAIIHLELASAQDKEVRKAIIEHIAPLADSLGLNEREALDVLEIIDRQSFNNVQNKKLSAPLLFEILLKIKEKCQTPRIQLHFFGMYLTLQNRGSKITPTQNRNGMLLASVIAALKAKTGSIDNLDKWILTQKNNVSDTGLEELKSLSDYLDSPKLLTTGICSLPEYDVIAVPTILINKPLTLVGMGDTISSVSLVGAL